jgi:uncharacterized membrane protein YqjE
MAATHLTSEQEPITAPRRLFGPPPTVGAGAAAKAVAEDASALVRAEIELAKAELTASVSQKAAGVGMLVGAGVLAWLGIQGLLITIAFALALVLPGWAAAAIVTGVLLLIGGILALVGKRKLATPVSLDTTKANVEEDVAWTKQHLAKR